MKKILVVDIGGSNVKLMISQEEKRRKFASGPKLTPDEAVDEIRKETSDWNFEAISIGFPAPVRTGRSRPTRNISARTGPASILRRRSGNRCE